MRKDCVEYDQPDELTAKVRRAILREWTDYVEEMVRTTSDRDAAGHIPKGEFRARMDSLFQESEPVIRGRSSMLLTGALGVTGRFRAGSSPTSATRTAMSLPASSNHGMMDSVGRIRRAHSRLPPGAAGGLGFRLRSAWWNGSRLESLLIKTCLRPLPRN